MSKIALKEADLEIPYAAAYAFVGVAFGIIAAILVILLSWPDEVERLFGPLQTFHPLFFLAVWSPALSAWAIILYFTGWSGFRGYLTRFRVWRCGPYWSLVIFVLIPLIYYIGAWFKGEPSWTLWPFANLSAGFAAIGLMAVLGPIEEFGWRDLLQPLLQRKYTPFSTAVIVGVIWGVWHLPAFFLSGLPQSNWDIIPFLIGTISVSVIITPLFNATRGGILLPMIIHFQLNNPLWPDAMPYDIPLFVLLAIILVWVYRTDMFDINSGVKRVTSLG